MSMNFQKKAFNKYILEETKNLIIKLMISLQKTTNMLVDSMGKFILMRINRMCQKLKKKKIN